MRVSKQPNHQLESLHHLKYGLTKIWQICLNKNNTGCLAVWNRYPAILEIVLSHLKVRVMILLFIYIYNKYINIWIFIYIYIMYRVYMENCVCVFFFKKIQNFLPPHWLFTKIGQIWQLIGVTVLWKCLAAMCRWGIGCSG